MKTTNDRMGGFISAEIIAIEDIGTFSVRNNHVTIMVKLGVKRNLLDIVKNGVDAQVTSSTNKGGEIFDINIRIEVKELLFLKYQSFNKCLVILEKPNGEMHVFGMPDFPLTIKMDPVYSKTPSGRVGAIATITGKQPNNVLILN